MAVAVFIMPIAVQWWAVWYPGAEPGGGSYIAQRMLASKSEKDALGAVLFFNVAHYVLRPWPWILVALCSILVYPELSDIQRAFPNLDPQPARARHRLSRRCSSSCRPGFVGLMVGGLIAANSSTILTHLNWGASYLVHDFYRRFIKRDAAENALRARRRALVTVGCSSASSATVYLLDTAKDAFDIILQIGAGTGLLYLVRWFWWRVNAWCEVVAMVSSFGVSLVLLVLARNGVAFSTHAALLMTVAVTTVCWVLDRVSRRRRPIATCWSRSTARCGRRARAGRRSAPRPARCRPTSAPRDNIPLALLGWFAGCTAIWSALFAVGNFLYGRTGMAWLLTAVFAVSGLVVIKIVARLWTAGGDR